MATRKAETTRKKTTASTRPSTSRTKSTVTSARSVSQKTVVKPAPRVASTRVTRDRRDRLGSTNLLAGLVAEFIGTFLLAGAVLHPQLGAAPFIMMFVIMALVLVFGSVSGAYLNPAFAVAAWATKRMSALRAVGYILMQVLGALLAFVVLNAYMNLQKPIDAELGMYGSAQNLALAKVTTFTAGKEWYMLGAEMLGTFIFALGLASALRNTGDRLVKALSVGGGLMLAMTVAGLASAAINGSVIMNPAVAVALQAFAVESGKLMWPIAIYVLGTTIAAVLAVAVYDLLARAARED